MAESARWIPVVLPTKKDENLWFVSNGLFKPWGKADRFSLPGIEYISDQLLEGGSFKNFHFFSWVRTYNNVRGAQGKKYIGFVLWKYLSLLYVIRSDGSTFNLAENELMGSKHSLIRESVLRLCGSAFSDCKEHTNHNGQEVIHLARFGLDWIEINCQRLGWYSGTYCG